MIEGVYVLELAPQRVKVGHSTNLADRVREHERTLLMADLTARQTWTCAVERSDLVERRMLRALDSLPGVTHFRDLAEVYSGVTFLEAVSICLGIAQAFPTAQPRVAEPRPWQRSSRKKAVRDRPRRVPNGPLGDGRTTRQIGVGWAIDNWRDDLRPMEVGEALLALGIQCSKGERSKILSEARLTMTRLREPAEPGTAADAAVIGDHSGVGDAHGAGTSAAHTG